MKRCSMILVICLILLFCLADNTFAGELIGVLQYWESDGKYIGAFSTTPNIYSASLGSYNISTLKTQVSNARNSWNSASGSMHNNY